MGNQDQDPLFLPDEVKSFTKEGNLILMTELTRQSNDFKRKIQAETTEVEKWTKRVELSRSRPELLEEAEAELAKHKRELLQAQMDLSSLEDRRTELRFQHNAPSTEQKFKTAQAQAMVQQFQAIGIDADTVKLDDQLKRVEADNALAAFKARAAASHELNNLSAQMTPKPHGPPPIPHGPPPIPHTSPSPQAPQGPQEITPGDIRRGMQLGQSLLIKGKIWQRVDAVNVGDTAMEEEHKLSCEGVLSRSKVDSLFPNGRRLADDGVEFEGSLSMTIRGLTPDRDILLVVRLDVAQPQDVEMLADGALVQTRPAEVDAQNRWRHETVLIPGSQVLMDDMIITRRAKEKTKSNMYALWVFQATS